MRPEHIKLSKTPETVSADAGHPDAFERKQNWKEQPGNRYTAEELRQMSGEFADCTMVRVRPKRRVMRIA